MKNISCFAALDVFHIEIAVHRSRWAAWVYNLSIPRTFFVLPENGNKVSKHKVLDWTDWIDITVWRVIHVNVNAETSKNLSCTTSVHQLNRKLLFIFWYLSWAARSY